MTNGTVYTRDGWPLTVQGPHVFNSSGVEVAQLHGGYAHDSRGRYVGTLDGNTLIYRQTDSVRLAQVFLPMHQIGSITARRLPAVILGDEPPIPL